MDTTAITENYALFILKEKGKIYVCDYLPYLCTSILIEMMLDGNLIITDKNKIKLTDNIPANTYSKQLYDILKENKQEQVSFKNFVSGLCYGFSDKKIKSVIQLLTESMMLKGLITMDMKKAVFGEKKILKVNEESFNHCIEKTRAVFLEKGDLTDELILFASLINYTKFIKNIFTKYEKESMENRLKEIKNTKIAEKVKLVESVIEEIILMTAAVAATVSLN